MKIDYKQQKREKQNKRNDVNVSDFKFLIFILFNYCFWFCVIYVINCHSSSFAIEFESE